MDVVLYFERDCSFQHSSSAASRRRLVLAIAHEQTQGIRTNLDDGGVILSEFSGRPATTPSQIKITCPTCLCGCEEDRGREQEMERERERKTAYIDAGVRTSGLYLAEVLLPKPLFPTGELQSIACSYDSLPQSKKIILFNERTHQQYFTATARYVYIHTSPWNSLRL